jgi:hypothetical protein
VSKGWRLHVLERETHLGQEACAARDEEALARVDLLHDRGVTLELELPTRAPPPFGRWDGYILSSHKKSIHKGFGVLCNN